MDFSKLISLANQNEHENKNQLKRSKDPVLEFKAPVKEDKPKRDMSAIQARLIAHQDRMKKQELASKQLKLAKAPEVAKPHALNGKALPTPGPPSQQGLPPRSSRITCISSSTALKNSVKHSQSATAPKPIPFGKSSADHKSASSKSVQDGNKHGKNGIVKPPQLANRSSATSGSIKLSSKEPQKQPPVRQREKIRPVLSIAPPPSFDEMIKLAAQLQKDPSLAKSDNFVPLDNFMKSGTAKGPALGKQRPGSIRPSAMNNHMANTKPKLDHQQSRKTNPVKHVDGARSLAQAGKSVSEPSLKVRSNVPVKPQLPVASKVRKEGQRIDKRTERSDFDKRPELKIPARPQNGLSSQHNPLQKKKQLAIRPSINSYPEVKRRPEIPSIKNSITSVPGRPEVSAAAIAKYKNGLAQNSAQAFQRSGIPSKAGSSKSKAPPPEQPGRPAPVYPEKFNPFQAALKKRPKPRYHEDDDDDEYDDEMDDFIDDTPYDTHDIGDVSETIRDIFGYDRRRYVSQEFDDDVDNMESSVQQQWKEEAISAYIGRKEDEREEELERQELARERARKKMKLSR